MNEHLARIIIIFISIILSTLMYMRRNDKAQGTCRSELVADVMHTLMYMRRNESSSSCFVGRKKSDSILHVSFQTTQLHDQCSTYRVQVCYRLRVSSLCVCSCRYPFIVLPAHWIAMNHSNHYHHYHCLHYRYLHYHRRNYRHYHYLHYHYP